MGSEKMVGTYKHNDTVSYPIDAVFIDERNHK